ncbi:MAG TPA: Hsp20/alpha crystallin family protein [Bacteroidales bacterium]|nr:Hsp20/alpha crystallin family protein [Bacteroidales bacterium]
MMRTNWPRLADDFFGGDLLNNFFDGYSGVKAPAVNIIEGKDDFRIEVAAPGLNKEDFNIQIDNNVLTISCEKENKIEDGEGKYMRREFSYSTFKRSFTLPESIDADKITAQHKDGILNITVPKKEEAKVKPSKQIAIA